MQAHRNGTMRYDVADKYSGDNSGDDEAAKSSGGGGGAAPTWDQIKGYFTPTDIQHMNAQGINLADCSQVAGAAQDILNVLNGGPPLMPPASAGGPWPKSQIAQFQAWVDAGAQCPPSGNLSATASGGSSAAPPTWAQVKVLFNATDVAHMKGQGINLEDCTEVSGAAQDILRCLNGGPPLMPPTSAGGPWPKDKIAIFAAWVNAGAKC
jgi:hypothetical protein